MNTPEYPDNADALLSNRPETSEPPSPDDARKLAVTAAGLSAVGGALAASVVIDGARDEYGSDVNTSDVTVIDDSIEVIADPEPPSFDSIDELFIYDEPGPLPEKAEGVDIRDVEMPSIVSSNFGPVDPNEIDCGLGADDLVGDDPIKFETDCDPLIV